MAAIDPVTAGGRNRVALLDAVAWSEIGPALLALPQCNDGYAVLVGATPADPLVFSNYARHPDVYNARLGSTAAGRYQILYRYWLIYQQRLGLPDFSPVSQDKYALQQFRERRALPLIDAGNLAGAVAAISSIWASLPGSPYGQHTQSMADIQSAYLAAGGTLAT